MKVNKQVVKSVRSYYGESADQFANRLGVSQDLVKKVENETRNANGIIKARILTRCDLTTSEINHIKQIAKRLRQNENE